MQVFISSVIAGFEAHRDAARRGAEMLGHQVVMAESFPASPTHPQRACISHARAADAVILLMGSRYSAPQESGISATHEEYRAVRDDDKVLVFVEDAEDRETEQGCFLNEVRRWERGHFTVTYATPDDLVECVVRGLRQFELARVAGPVDEAALETRARDAIPGDDERNSALSLAVAAGPTQTLVRPAELDPHTLGRALARELLFGSDALFELAGAADPRMDHKRLIVPHSRGRLTLDGAGTIYVEQPAEPSALRRSGFRPAIEEDVRERLGKALRIAGRILEIIDGNGRATTVVPLAGLSGGVAWLTQEEYNANPNRINLSLFPRPAIVALTPAGRRREALLADSGSLAEDLTVLLQREIKSRGFFQR